MNIKLKTPNKNGWVVDARLRDKSGAFFLGENNKKDTQISVHGTEEFTDISLFFTPPSPGYFTGMLARCRWSKYQC